MNVPPVIPAKPTGASTALAASTGAGGEDFASMMIPTVQDDGHPVKTTDATGSEIPSDPAVTIIAELTGTAVRPTVQLPGNVIQSLIAESKLQSKESLPVRSELQLVGDIEAVLAAPALPGATTGDGGTKAAVAGEPPVSAGPPTVPARPNTPAVATPRIGAVVASATPKNPTEASSGPISLASVPPDITNPAQDPQAKAEPTRQASSGPTIAVPAVHESAGASPTPSSTVVVDGGTPPNGQPTPLPVPPVAERSTASTDLGLGTHGLKPHTAEPGQSGTSKRNAAISPAPGINVGISPAPLQNSSGMAKNPSGMAQNPSGMAQNPSNITKNPSNITQNSSRMTKHPSGMVKNPSRMTQNPSGMTQNSSGMANATTANPDIVGPEASLDGASRAAGTPSDGATAKAAPLTSGAGANPAAAQSGTINDTAAAFGGDLRLGADSVRPASVDQAFRGQPLQPASQQIAVQISRAVQQGTDRITVNLKPASLGHISVNLEIGPDNRLIAVIAADRPETLDLMQRDARALERALNDAGLKTDSGSLSFNLRGDGNGDHAGGDDASDWSSYAAPDTADDATPTPIYARTLRADGGIDIRV